MRYIVQERISALDLDAHGAGQQTLRHARLAYPGIAKGSLAIVTKHILDHRGEANYVRSRETAWAFSFERYGPGDNLVRR